MHCNLSYKSIYMVLYSTDSHWSISPKVQEGNVIWHKTLRMLKLHPIPAFMKTYTNFKKYFWLGLFWLKYIFRIKFKIPILDLMILQKNSVPFEGYTPVYVLRLWINTFSTYPQILFFAHQIPADDDVHCLHDLAGISI